MKKLILAFFLFMSVINTGMAPPTTNPVICIPEGTIIIYNSGGTYAPLITAMFKYEASEDPFAVNDAEGAFGGLQIRQCRLDHYNSLNGTNYTLEDCFSFELSKEIFLYFTNHDSEGRVIPSKSWEQAAKDWNGSGPKTETYWEIVKNLI